MPVQRVYLSTAASTASQSFSISNPFGLTVSWTYPALTGVSWSTTNTGITLTAAQGTTLATTSVTITAGYGAFSYPYIFSLNINPNTLQNPGDVILYTLTSATLTLNLNNPSSAIVTWSYPTLAGVSWTATNTGITLTAVQGLYMTVTSVTVTAVVNGTPYSSTFNLTINNSFTFTTLNGATTTAPTSLSSYSSYPSNLTLISGIQYWTVPTTTSYNFTVAGAGNASGYGEQGAVLYGSYTLNKNSLLAICVGQKGVQVNTRGGCGGTFVTTVPSINTTSLLSAIPLFIAGGAGGVYSSVGNANASLTITGNTGSGNGGIGGIGPNSGTVGGVYGGSAGGAGGGGFNSFKLNGGSGGGAFGLGGAGSGYNMGGGGGGYGGGGGGGGGTFNGGGGGGLYDITYLFNCSATNLGQGYVTVDTSIRFSLSNVGSTFLFTSPTGSSLFIPLTLSTSNPYGLIPMYTSSPSISGITLTSSSLAGVSINAAQGTSVVTQSFTITPTYGLYSNPITITLSCGPNPSFYILPVTRILYTAYPSSYVRIATVNPYSVIPTWSLSPSIDYSSITTATQYMLLSYYSSAFAQKTMTVTAGYGSYLYSQTFPLQTNSTVLSLPSVYTSGSVSNRLTGVAVYNTLESYLAFDTRGTSGGAYPNNYLCAGPQDTITAIFNIVYTNNTSSYKSIWIHNGSSWAYNPFTAQNVQPVATSEYTYTFTIPSLAAGLYSIVFMNSYYGFYNPSYNDISRSYAEFVLLINDYTPSFVLSNPGTTSLNTISGQSAPVVLTLTNPYNVTTTWTYPKISGVTWTPTNTGITAVAAQGTSYATNTITVQANFLTYSYPQSFSLYIDNTPGFVLSNPGTTTLYTINQSAQVALTLTNPFNLTPTWTYPTITGVTWTPTNTGITAVAAQGSSYATNTITVQASYSTFNYPQSFSFTINNTAGFVLSNPGTTTLYTLNGQVPLTLTLTNPLNLTPTWSYPTITGVTWTPSNTGITATAAQGSSYATNTITVQASYSTFNYPQAFSFTINNTAKTLNGIVSTFVGGLYYPYGATHDQTNTLYVADSNNSDIKKVNTTTAAVTSLVGLNVWSVAYDGSTYLYATDNNNHVIYRINASTGAYTTFAGSAGSAGSADGTGTAATFNFPSGITYSSAGFLYVTDTNNHTIRRISVPGAVVTTFAGSAGSAGSADGTGSAAQFYLPFDLTYDGTGKLYVADSYNYTIRSIVVSTAAVTTLAGSAGSTGSTDGTGSAARFNTPSGITYDGTSKLYVSDTINNTIRSIVISTAAVTTLAGTAGSASYVDGTGSAARFNTPNGITCNKSNGILYVVDSFNSVIRKII